MPELQLMFNRHRKYMLYLLSLYILGWGFTQYQSVFLGLFFGTTISLYNHWLMVRRTKRFGEAVETGAKFRSFGTVTRMVAAVLAVMVATRYPDYFNFLCVILGLMTSYVVIMIDFIIHHIIQSHK
ncbi:ATP synthase subunit I [Heyndrickxia oleronia]|uniref:ATP synthase subunit I n=1 Tax=Heyndrickxia oleronia TaxID=38875 RepID=UPI002430C96E|nr:ATP synthase subunit I [Heyndrickxia oleronia]MCI1589311.1 ATP synthase subunit I [Heyndrickxia oleronia]MCI1612398.1 ATP synthase subunit I [Heyndrickxia oleronia]MCI1743640.1 ATP synthase subunit I [Heyndrickxia oleronia]MCI1760347.1 ATP synthase subunit I [Heyndrickxia oleronia]